jgi:hypothetical protein
MNEFKHYKTFWWYVFSDAKKVLIIFLLVAILIISEMIMDITNPNITYHFYIELLMVLILCFIALLFRYYCYLEKNNAILSREQPTIDMLNFTRSFAPDEQKQLFDGLTSGGFLSKETNFHHFCFVFGSTDIPSNEAPFEPLQWVKPNKTTHGKNTNKKSLLELIVLLEIPEIEIKDKQLINSVFKIPNGTKFKANNYTDITDKNGNLIRFESEYHTELVEIIRKSKENKAL